MTQHRNWKDWLLLFALVAMWGSSFMFNKLGVKTVSPATLVAARLVIGTAILLAVVYGRGLRLPPPGRIWLYYFALAMVGNAIPFYSITWGQQVVDSSLAGILMAAMPLVTLVLAHFLVDGERMTARKVGGFLLGFAGIVVLIGPTALGRVGGGMLELLSQFAVLLGAACYATNSVMARLMIKGEFLVAAASTLLLAALVMVPIAAVMDQPWNGSPSAGSVAAIVWLGVGPTAIATICYYRLISSAGPTFMSLVNYLSPAVALFLGVSLLGEHPGANAYAGLLCILAGIALSQWRRGLKS